MDFGSIRDTLLHDAVPCVDELTLLTIAMFHYTKVVIVTFKH